MNKIAIVFRVILLFRASLCFSQTEGKLTDSLQFKGQLSAWEHFNPSNSFSFFSGIRYIPQLNYEVFNQQSRKLDFEASANIYGSLGIHPFDTADAYGDLKAYRFWARYSSPRFEARLGMQKINFGSASLLRPLMWFDQVDPRDPLQLTDGVWGLLTRYYFLNNANIWLWALYGNEATRGWEAMKTNSKIPEAGGRFQTPVPGGEAAVSYHYRVADSRGFMIENRRFEHIPENRIGLDAKFDLKLGLWFESTWVHKSANMGDFKNQHLLNLGTDYTFGIGNGLTIIYEQLLFTYTEKAFNFNRVNSFSLLNLSYPVGIFDQLSLLTYIDVGHKTTYNFLNWQRQFNRFSIFFMFYANPKNYLIPARSVSEISFSGNGMLIMLVLNH